MPHLCWVQHQKLHICKLLCCASGWCHARSYEILCVCVCVCMLLVIFLIFYVLWLSGMCRYHSLFSHSAEKKKKKNHSGLIHQHWAFALLWNKLPNDSQLRLNTHMSRELTQKQWERKLTNWKRLHRSAVCHVSYEHLIKLLDSETNLFDVGKWECWASQQKL